MNDKEWLHRVKLAVDVYKEQYKSVPSEYEHIDKFIVWLHQQYGIVL